MFFVKIQILFNIYTMKRIKNWKLFNESVQDSLDDIKWVIVDYDIEDYEYFPNSTKLLSFLVNGDDKVQKEINRIKGLASEEGWNVILRESDSALIFYKGDLESAVINWLDENYVDLNVKTITDRNNRNVYYMLKDHYGSVLFKHNVDEPFDVEANSIFYELPEICLKNKTSVLLEKWMKKTFGIDVRAIYFE